MLGLPDLIKFTLQILITHHVELVLPGTYYMARMLDGRIDQQGVVSELRECGVLDYVAQDAELHVKAEEKEEDMKERTADEAVAIVVTGGAESGTEAKAPPRKLVQDEERQEGAVKFNVYNKYLQASYAINCYEN